MSRSRRKTPIVGYTTCRSEREDKTIWHRRLRAHEHTGLTGADAERLEAWLPVSVRQVSNPWAMGKDGRQYVSARRRAEWARWQAQKGRTAREQAALERRFLRKWLAK